MHVVHGDQRREVGLRVRLGADLRRILLDAGTTALLVTHDQDEAFAVADRVALMRAGRIVQEGPVAEVWAQPVDDEAREFLGARRSFAGDDAARILAAAGLPDEPGVSIVVRPAMGKEWGGVS